VFVVVGSRDGPVSDRHVRELWGGVGLPPLPADLVVRVDPDQVRLEAGEWRRDVGAPEDVADPVEQVQQRLEAFRGKLRRSGGVSCDGLAFGHP
jgi:hypothetical protein